MTNKEFVVLNAFASRPFGGNPAAVFPNASGIPEEQLQLIARQLNLIETVFVVPPVHPQAQCRLRYFTPLEEIPVAGHPTIATWVALAQFGIVSVNDQATFVQETKAGLQEIEVSRVDGGFRVVMKQPAAMFGETVRDPVIVASAIGLTPEDLDPTLPVQAVNVGLGHVIVPVRNLQAMLRARMEIEKVRDLCVSLGMREIQFFAFEAHSSEFDLFTRNFTPREGLEDPACGNGNGALGAYLAAHRFPHAAEFRLKAEQGVTVNLPSVIEIDVNRTSHGEVEVRIGGTAVPMVSGKVLV